MDDWGRLVNIAEKTDLFDFAANNIPALVDVNFVFLCKTSVACFNYPRWPAPGSADTELGVLMEPEVCHGETEV
jgi:hypothetical protein